MNQRTAPTAPKGSPQPLPEAGPSLLVEVPQLFSHRSLLVDTREPETYRSGHLPGAVNLTPSSLERHLVLPGGAEIHHLLAPADRAASVLASAGIGGESRVVLYDEGSGYSAARLFWILDYLGHRRLQILNGGLAAWLWHGRPLAFDIPHPKRGDFSPEPDPLKLAEYETVRAAVGKKGVVLLNTLPESSFAAEAIPGSVNVPYTKTYQVRRTGRMYATRHLRELLRSASIHPHQEVIPYCGIGYTASQLYFTACLLGYPNVRLYDGSMEDWKARGGTVVRGDLPAASKH